MRKYIEVKDDFFAKQVCINMSLVLTALATVVAKDPLRTIASRYILSFVFQSPREYTEHERRQLLIARLPNVETLNGGGVISCEEREDAERAFIRYYMDKPEADRPER